MSRKKQNRQPAEQKPAQVPVVEGEKRDDSTGQFVKGHIGGPGRPKGSRNKLGEAFIHDMYEAWQSQGKAVIADVIKDDPATFLRSMVALMPKEMDVNVNHYETMTDEQLRTQFIAALREARTLGVDLGAGEPASLH